MCQCVCLLLVCISSMRLSVCLLSCVSVPCPYVSRVFLFVCCVLIPTDGRAPRTHSITHSAMTDQKSRPNLLRGTSAVEVTIPRGPVLTSPEGKKMAGNMVETPNPTHFSRHQPFSTEERPFIPVSGCEFLSTTSTMLVYALTHFYHFTHVCISRTV